MSCWRVLPVPTAKIPDSPIIPQSTPPPLWEAGVKMKCNTFFFFLFILFFCIKCSLFLGGVFVTQVSRKVQLPLTRRPIALKVLCCNNYQKYRNSCKHENIFWYIFLQHGEKTVLAWMFCFAVRHKENKGMDFLFSIKGQYHILVWSTPECVETRQVRKRSAQIWLSFISVAVGGQMVFKPPGGPCLFRRNPKVCKYSFYSLYRCVLSAALFGKSANRNKCRTVRYYLLCFFVFVL